MSDKPIYEKMSKSRGNVVLPEEVVYGVADLAPEHNFRFPNGEIADWEKFNIWQNCLHDGFFYTATRFGRVPVFLHYEDNPIPALLTINEVPTLQHPELKEYWNWLWEDMEKHNYKDEDVYPQLKEWVKTNGQN